MHIDKINHITWGRISTVFDIILGITLKQVRKQMDSILKSNKLKRCTGFNLEP